MSSSDDDSQGLVLGVVFGVIALVIALVFGVSIYATRAMAPAAAPAPMVAVVAEDVASVKVEGGVVKFYFATARADVAPGANEALAEVVKAVGEGKRALISGFHDATGDAAKNAELAKQRAFAVRDVLKALGVAEDRMELKKPEETQGSGSNAEARRVEVTVLP
ncbi:OmpA family protein [Tibeticola sp.]|uniref:OmpA family protein n=1 Tax=Tibeticola sp. TaxID=2005368 RepID=UPI0025FBCBF8|nr:OmpA family protein [Tibeticola sp.]